jgi:hypothetical protein
MPYGRISDWIERINKIPELKDNFSYIDNKIKDQLSLRKFKLPVPDSLPMLIKNLDKQKIEKFLNKHKGIFIRVIPTKEGLDKGLKKLFKFGYLSLNECLEFIKDSVNKDESYYSIEVQEWSPTKYAWILISNGNKIIAEISEDLDKLAHYNQEALSSIIIERDNQEKTMTWLKKEESSAPCLLNALRYLEKRSDKDYFLKGYFEGITTTENKIMFFDFKENDIYLRMSRTTSQRPVA